MNSILIPRNLDSRLEKQKRIDYQRIQEYIKNGSKGDLDLRKTLLTKLPDNLIEVGGSLSTYGSYIEDLNNLKHVGHSLRIEGTNIGELPIGLVVEKDVWCWNNSLSRIYSSKYFLKKYIKERNIKVGGQLIMF